MSSNDRLIEISEDGDLDEIKSLIESTSPRAINIDFQNKDGWTALMNACKEGHLDIVKYLIANGAVDTNFHTEYLNTSLMVASEYGHVDVVNYLVENLRVDVNIKDNNGWTALSVACVISGNETDSSNRYLSIVICLLKNGADVNTRNKNGFTPLMYASENGNVNVVKLLIDYGALKNLRNNDGQTAKMLAKTEEIRKLLE